mgnify:CR=1 FL=1
MRTQLKNTIQLLQDQVYANLKEIRKNEAQIREILNEPVSDHRSNKLKEKQDMNKAYLNENKESIKIQNSILNLLQMRREAGHEVEEETSRINLLLNEINGDGEGEDPKKESCVSDPDQCFQQTVAGEIPFDEDHPFFNEVFFINNLLNYYTEIEAYEMCSYLMKLKEDAEQTQAV